MHIGNNTPLNHGGDNKDTGGKPETGFTIFGSFTDGVFSSTQNLVYQNNDIENSVYKTKKPVEYIHFSENGFYVVLGSDQGITMPEDPADHSNCMHTRKAARNPDYDKSPTPYNCKRMGSIDTGVIEIPEHYRTYRPTVHQNGAIVLSSKMDSLYGADHTFEFAMDYDHDGDADKIKVFHPDVRHVVGFDYLVKDNKKSINPKKDAETSFQSTETIYLKSAPNTPVTHTVQHSGPTSEEGIIKSHTNIMNDDIAIRTITYERVMTQPSKFGEDKKETMVKTILTQRANSAGPTVVEK